MDAATVEKLRELGVKAADPLNRVIRPPAEPPHVYYLIDKDGTPKQVEAQPPRERSACLSVPSLCDWVKHEAEFNPLVWYSRTGVVAISATVERTTFALTPSAQLKALSAVAERSDGVDYEQGTLWRLLRTTYHGCLPSHSDLKERVGRVDVKKAQEAAGTVDRKGTSVSRKLLAEASGADQLPEVLTFDVPVFEQAAATVKASVRAAFDFDAQAERFKLCVLPGEIERAFAVGEKWLENMLAQELGERGMGDVPVFYGRPE